MHTCPNCGKDSDASVTEPCPHCGFDPLAAAGGNQDADAAEFGLGPDDDFDPVPTLAGSGADDEPKPGPGGGPEQEPAPPPVTGAPLPVPPEPQSSSLSLWRRLITSRVAIGAAIVGGLAAIGALNSNSSHPGPSASQAESALTKDAAKLNLTVVVSCPDSAQDTKVGATFTCTATDGQGNTVSIDVINQKSQFRWSRQPFLNLRQRENHR